MRDGALPTRFYFLQMLTLLSQYKNTLFKSTLLLKELCTNVFKLESNYKMNEMKCMNGAS